MKPLGMLLFLYLIPAAWLLDSRWSGVSLASPNKETQEDTIDLPVTGLGEVGQKYRLNRGIKMNLKKAVYSKLMGEETQSEGTLIYSQGRLKMKILKPHRTMIVVDGDIVWVVNELSKEEGGKTQVLKFKENSDKAGANKILAIIFDENKLFKAFTMTSTSRQGEFTHYELKPKKPMQNSDYVKIAVVVNEKKGEIKELSYWDDLENRTTYKFSKIKFGEKLAKKEFAYKPPKDAEVTVY